MARHVVVTPLQVVDPSFVLDVPGLVRAGVAFGLVLVVGAVILWRYGGVVDRSIDASVDRPLAALGYGVAAHITIAFFGVYAASQLGQLTVSGRSLAGLGIYLGLFVLAVVAAMGFTVVGVALVEVQLGRPRWYGLVLGAAVAGFAGLVDPVVGGLVWIVVVSTGIGGPVRRWFHAAEDVEAAT